MLALDMTNGAVFDLVVFGPLAIVGLIVTIVKVARGDWT
jgi:hypothetical protein